MLLLSFPILLPTYILALSWAVWLLPALSLGQGGTAFTATGALPTLCVWAAALYPLPLWATFVALQRWNEAWSEAASVNGVVPIWNIWLRARYLTVPVSAAVLLIWLFMLSDFAVPDYFRVSLYGTETFVEIASYGNVRGAIIASLPCVAAAFLAMLAIARLWRRWQLTTDAAERATPTAQLSTTSAAARNASAGAVCIAVGGVLLFVVLPLITLVHTAGEVGLFVALWPAIWPDGLLSATLSLIVATAVVLLATVTAYVTQRGVTRSPSIMRAALAATFAIPSALLGLAGIALWNQPGAIGSVYTSGAALVLLLVARWLPLAHELQYAGFRSVPPQLEEVAWTSGVPWSQSTGHIVLRYCREPLLATGLLIFILTFNDLTLAALLAPPGWSTLPLRVFSTVHYGSAATLAATCLWQLLFLLIPLAALAWLARRAGQQR